MIIELPYGTGKKTIELDKAHVVYGHDEIKMAGTEEDIVEKALLNPIDSLPLCDLAQDKKHCVLILSDHTRPVPSKILVPMMLREVRKKNKHIQVTLLVATGLHRQTTKEDLIRKLGSELVEQETIVVHDADAPCKEVGMLPSGIPLSLNPLVCDADLVISEGFIEPHFFAGFSGGRKSILPGVASRASIMGNHAGAQIAHPLARTGILKGNPVNEDMECAARIGALRFILNVILDDNKKVIAAFAGDPISAHHAGCDFLLKRARVTCVPSDLVITSNGGFPLDQNVYQCVKSMSTADGILKEKGVIIVLGACQDGIGGAGFYESLRTCKSVVVLYETYCTTPKEETIPDQWQTQIFLRILKDHPIIMVTDPKLQKQIEEMHMFYAPTIEEALIRAKELLGKEPEQITVIPDGVSLMASV